MAESSGEGFGDPGGFAGEDASGLGAVNGSDSMSDGFSGTVGGFGGDGFGDFGGDGLAGMFGDQGMPGSTYGFGGTAMNDPGSQFYAGSYANQPSEFGGAPTFSDKVGDYLKGRFTPKSLAMMALDKAHPIAGLVGRVATGTSGEAKGGTIGSFIGRGIGGIAGAALGPAGSFLGSQLGGYIGGGFGSQMGGLDSTPQMNVDAMSHPANNANPNGYGINSGGNGFNGYGDGMSAGGPQFFTDANGISYNQNGDRVFNNVIEHGADAGYTPQGLFVGIGPGNGNGKVMPRELYEDRETRDMLKMPVGTGSAIAAGPNESGSSMFGNVNIGGVLEGLGGMYMGQQANKTNQALQSGLNANNNQSQQVFQQQMQTLNDMYRQDGPYAQQLRQQMERKDAAGGRRSQYGPREVELQAKLAEMQSRNADNIMRANSQNQQLRQGGLLAANQAGQAGNKTNAQQLAQLYGIAKSSGLTGWAGGQLKDMFAGGGSGSGGGYSPSNVGSYGDFSIPMADSGAGWADTPVDTGNYGDVGSNDFWSDWN